MVATEVIYVRVQLPIKEAISEIAENHQVSQARIVRRAMEVYLVEFCGVELPELP